MDLYLAILIVSVTLSTTIMAIMGPLLVSIYPSEYFVILCTTIEFLIIFALFHFSCRKLYIEKHNLIIQVGIFNAFMAIAILYSSGPDKTAPVMQSALSSIAVIPTAIIRYFSFEKKPEYDYLYVSLSSISLLISIILSAIPMTNDNDRLGWSILFFSGICARCYYNVLQEKYISETETIEMTNRQRLANKVSLAFYSRIVMLAIIIPIFAFEWTTKKGNEPLNDLYKSLNIAFTSYFEGFVLQGFVISYFCLFFLSMYLNAISTNYHMILMAIANPSVGLFYSIVPLGFQQYPLWIIILSIFFATLATYFWTLADNGEFVPDKELIIKVKNGDYYQVTCDSI